LIQIRILTPDLIRNLIRMQMADSQVPIVCVPADVSLRDCFVSLMFCLTAYLCRFSSSVMMY